MMNDYMMHYVTVDLIGIVAPFVHAFILTISSRISTSIWATLDRQVELVFELLAKLLVEFN